MKYFIFYFIVTLLLITCSNQLIETDFQNDSPGNIFLKLNVGDAPPEADHLAGFLSRHDQDTVFFDLIISNNYASAFIEGLIHGEWNLQIDAYNSENVVIYTGNSNIMIVPGETTSITIQLHPATGSLEINVTWGSSGEYGLLFDGINDYIQIPDNDHLNMVSSYSLESWIYPFDVTTNPGGGGRTIIRKGNVYHNVNQNLVINVFRGPGLLQFGFTGSGIGSIENSVTANAWQHVAGVYDNDSELLKLYVNGELIEERPSGSLPQISIDPVTIGATFRGDGLGIEDYFHGIIKDVRIWSIALTQEQILEKMYIQLEGTETGLVANWKMKEGFGQTIHDEANKNNGFLGSHNEIDDSDPNWIIIPNMTQ